MPKLKTHKGVAKVLKSRKLDIQDKDIILERKILNTIEIWEIKVFYQEQIEED